MAGEKTEKATPKRKEDERKKGNIFQSKELVTVFSLVIVFYSLKWLGPYAMNSMQGSIYYFFDLAATKPTLRQSDIGQIFIKSCTVFVISAMPVLIISSLVAIAFTVAQTRGLFSTKAMQFKMNRMSPIQGFKRMFSMRGIVELLKSIIKVCVIGYIIYTQFAERIMILPRLMDMEPQQALTYTGEFILSIVTTTAAIFIFLAVADYVYQWWDYEKNLRMSKDEIKEEYKQTEGDPQVKGKIKEKQRQMARSRMMAAVPGADVIIRNPTHYAIAIKYSPDIGRAPVVIAKGADRVALKIVEIGEKNGVMTIENKPLARGLFEAVDIDREIPENFYQPVAEVLAFVYSLKKKDLK